MKKQAEFAMRYQDFFGWMPLMLVLSILAWVVLGAVSDRDDLVRWLIELPVKTLYATAASGVSYLVWRRWSYRMSDDELRSYWGKLLSGEPGAMAVHITNTVFYLCTFVSLLYYFSH